MTAHSSRLTKDEGWCKQCSRSDIGVSWHPGSRAWYCVDCWPALKEKGGSTERREASLPTFEELQRLRDSMYGYRIEDDPRPDHLASFVALCPEHGVLGDGLTISDARASLSAHVVAIH